LPVGLYGGEIVFRILRTDYKLRVFEKRVLRKVPVFKRDEIIGDWRKFRIIWLYINIIHNS
jgi:hypothetical protein